MRDAPAMKAEFEKYYDDTEAFLLTKSKRHRNYRSWLQAQPLYPENVNFPSSSGRQRGEALARDLHRLNALRSFGPSEAKRIEASARA